MPKVVTAEQSVNMIHDGMTIMVGGFMGCGSPHKIVAALAKKGVKNLILICNDAAWPGYGVAQLLTRHQVKKLIGTHVGLNPEVALLMSSGEMELELIPQGTFVERIRCGGNGLGGFLTPTGVGTMVANDKQVITIDGKVYLLELPLRADVALICGNKVDKNGNVWYKGSTRNFNVAMATAADIVIAEADNLVELGEIEPENVVTPGTFVNYIVDGEVE